LRVRAVRSQQLDQQRDISVVSCFRTLHTYLNLLKQLAESFKLDVSSTVFNNKAKLTMRKSHGYKFFHTI